MAVLMICCSAKPGFRDRRVWDPVAASVSTQRMLAWPLVDKRNAQAQRMQVYKGACVSLSVLTHMSMFIHVSSE